MVSVPSFVKDVVVGMATVATLSGCSTEPEISSEVPTAPVESIAVDTHGEVAKLVDRVAQGSGQSLVYGTIPENAAGYIFDSSLCGNTGITNGVILEGMQLDGMVLQNEDGTTAAVLPFNLPNDQKIGIKVTYVRDCNDEQPIEPGYSMIYTALDDDERAVQYQAFLSVYQQFYPGFGQ